MQTQYRPEIDGLRTIAVLSVLIYHANFNIGDWSLLPGGFLGVDVFFVISGYLITLILLKEMQNQQFSFRGFYERRARRILPVLFLVLAVSSVFAWVLMLPKALTEFAGSQLSALFFGSNFWFWLEDSYFAEVSELKPLLHTWSLSIEEQFYVFFPILLLLLMRWFNGNLVKIAWVLAGLAVASLGLAQVYSGYDVDANFYLPFTRSWELLAGCLVAVYERSKGRELLNNSLPSVTALLAIGLIVVPMFFYHDRLPHPSVLTLVPIIGTALLIISTPQQSVSYKLLASKPFVGIGLISYSLYLWHFPIFAYARIYKVGELSDLEKLACLGLSFVLTVIGYYLVEQPARDRKRTSGNVFYSGLLIALVALVAFSVYVLKASGVPSRLGEIQHIFEGARHEDSYLLKDGRRCDIKPIGIKSSCFFEAPKENVSGRAIINVGDSHADVLGNALRTLAEQNNFDYRHLTLSGCPYVLGAYRFKTGPVNSRCDAKQMQRINRVLKNTPPSIVVYTARLPGYISGEPFDNQEGGREPQASNRKLRVDPEGRWPDKTLAELINLTVEDLNRMGHTVVMIYPIPEVGWDVPKLVKKRLDAVAETSIGAKNRAFKAMEISTSLEVYRQRVADTVTILDRIEGISDPKQGAFPALLRVYPDRVFCSVQAGRCYTHDEEHLYYYDDNHLSVTGTTRLVAALAEKLAIKFATKE